MEIDADEAAVYAPQFNHSNNSSSQISKSASKVSNGGVLPSEAGNGTPSTGSSRGNVLMKVIVELPTLTRDLKALEQFLIEKQDALELREAEISAMRVQSDTSLGSELANARSELSAMARQRDSALAEVSVLNARVEERDLTIQDLTRRVNETSSMQEHIQKLQASHAKQVKALEDRNAALTAENARLTSIIGEKEAEVREVHKKYLDTLTQHRDERARARQALVEAMRMAARVVDSDSQPDTFGEVFREIDDVRPPASPRATAAKAGAARDPTPAAVSSQPAHKSPAKAIATPSQPPASGSVSGKRSRAEFGEDPSSSELRPTKLPTTSIVTPAKESQSLHLSPPGTSEVQLNTSGIAASTSAASQDPRATVAAGTHGTPAPQSSPAAADEGSAVKAAPSQSQAVARTATTTAPAPAAASSQVDTSNSNNTAAAVLATPGLHEAYLWRVPNNQLQSQLHQAITANNVPALRQLWKEVDAQLATVATASPDSQSFLVGLGGRHGEVLPIGRDHPSKTAAEGPSTGMRDAKVSRKQLTVKVMERHARITNLGMNVVYIITQAEIDACRASGSSFPRGKPINKNESGDILPGDHLVFCVFNEKDPGFLTEDPYRPKPFHHFVFRMESKQ